MSTANTERDNEDFYGYISHASQNGWLVSCDVPVLEKDPEETLVIAVNGEKGRVACREGIQALL